MSCDPGDSIASRAGKYQCTRPEAHPHFQSHFIIITQPNDRTPQIALGIFAVAGLGNQLRVVRRSWKSSVGT